LVELIAALVPLGNTVYVGVPSSRRLADGLDWKLNVGDSVDTVTAGEYVSNVVAE